jgi:uncharacterized membrane protein/cbb3-type cytochrome oxidase subunit 3
MTNCCFCIKLKAGVVIISLLWLIEGTFGTVNNILILTSSNKEISVYDYVSVFTIPITIIHGLITIGAIFGLYVLTCAPTSKMLLIYSKVAYCIAGIESIFRILIIIVIVIYKSAFLEDCTNSIENISSRVEYSSDACNQGYVYSLTFAIAFGVVVILLSLYFAMVISAYAHKRKEKEYIAAETKDEESDKVQKQSSM